MKQKVRTMKTFNGLKAIALTGMTALALGVGINSAIGLEFSNGDTAFEQSPRLLKTSASNNIISNARTTYRFKVHVPEAAGEPLKALRIEQLDNVETIRFLDQTSRASVGTQKADVSLAAIGGKAEPGVLNVVFAEPIQPGNTVTVSVSPRRNPRTENIYQFGVTAFPEGTQGRGEFLGYGRLSFYSSR